MRETDPGRIGERLGVSAGAVRRLQARGYLRSLELSDNEIRYRLWRGHLAASHPLAERQDTFGRSTGCDRS